MGILEDLMRDLLRAMDILGLTKSKQNKLYDISYSCLGHDVSPNDIAPDELACAESLSRVIQIAFPELNFPTYINTRQLYDHFIRSPSFQEADEEDYGLIVISVTGMGNGVVKHGHAGVVGKYNSSDGSPWIMSNDSRSGTWEASFTLNSWERYYKYKGGMQTHFFRIV